jgi:hypothetical protein
MPALKFWLVIAMLFYHVFYTDHNVSQNAVFSYSSLALISTRYLKKRPKHSASSVSHNGIARFPSQKQSCILREKSEIQTFQNLEGQGHLRLSIRSECWQFVPKIKFMNSPSYITPNKNDVLLF